MIKGREGGRSQIIDSKDKSHHARRRRGPGQSPPVDPLPQHRQQRRGQAQRRRDCQEFRVRAGIVGKKETPHAPTQTTGDRRRAA